MPFKIAEETLVKTGRDYWKEYCQYLTNIIGDEKVVNYVLARFAFRLMNPGIRTNVILMIGGSDYDSKNQLLTPMYNTMKEYTGRSSNSKQLYQKRLNVENPKFFVRLYDTGGVDYLNNMKVLKNLTMESTLHVNEICDYDMITDHHDIVKLSDDSKRQFVKIETTSYYLNNHAFFNDYRVNIENNPVALRQIYDGLIHFDYKSIVPSLNFQDVRYKPTSNVEPRVQRQGRDKIICFFEDIVKKNLKSKSQKEIKYKNIDFFKMYVDWCDESKLEIDYNKFTFGMKVSLLMKTQLNTGGFSCLKKDLSHSTTMMCKMFTNNRKS